jgi:ParB/RepB/Spo0J family partition protein
VTVAQDIIALEIRFLETPYQELRIRDRRIERDLLVSLEETGQQFPIWVIPSDRSGFFVVIDGHRRVRALRKLGQDQVRAQILALSAADALLWARMSQTEAHLTALEEGLLLRELVEGQHLTLDAIAVRIGRSKSWVSRRLDLIGVLPDQVRRMVVAGQVPPSSAMKVLVPLARANIQHAEIFARAIAEGKLSTREVETLYAYYRSPDSLVRETLLSNPLKFLKAEQAYRQSTDAPDTEEQEMLERLERLTVMVTSTTTRVRKLLREGNESPPIRRLAPACALARQALETLMGVLTPVMQSEKGGCDGPRGEETAHL